MPAILTTRLPLGIGLFLAGILISAWFPGLSPGYFITLLALLLVAWCRRPDFFLPVLLVVTGTAWMNWHAAQVHHDDLPEEWVGADLLVTGYVVGLPSGRNGSKRYLFQALSISKGEQELQGGLIRLSDYRSQPLNLKAGEAWQLVVRIKPASGLVNQGSFDYERWLFAQHIGMTGYIREDALNRRHPSLDVPAPIDRQRSRIVAEVGSALDGNAHSGLVTALAVGDRRGISPRQWEVLRETGTAHLMAISGLHVGLVAWLGYMLGSLVWRLSPRLLHHLPAQKAGMLLAVAVANFYSLLAGFTLPTQRALIMLAVIAVATLSDRNVRPLSVLSLSLLLVLLHDPLSVLSSGFWLSFGAVAIIFYSLMYRNDDNRITAAARMQLRISLMLAPLTLLLFGQFSIVSPMANAVAIPFVTFLVVPLVLLATGLLLAGYSGLADWLLHAADSSLALLWPLLDWLTALENMVDAWPVFAQPVMSASVLMIMLLMLPAGLYLRFLIVPLSLVVLMPDRTDLGEGEFRLTILDVGQGLSVVVQTRDHVLLFDSGARFSETFDIGDAVVLPVLQHKGISQLDTMLISHGDNDHIGGAASVLDGMRVDHVLSNEILHGHAVQTCTEGREWDWNGIRFNILHPSDASKSRSGNDASCVLMVDSPYGRVLVPADIESVAESRLVRDYGHTLRADILVAPHHGSRTSSTPEFIEQVDPEVVLVSAGWRNRYRHPSHEVVQRYHDKGVGVASTAQCGALDVFVGREGKTVTAERSTQRLWRRREADCPFL